MLLDRLGRRDLVAGGEAISCWRHECRSYGAHMAAWRCDLDGSGSAIARALRPFSTGGSGSKHSGTCGGVAAAARDFSEL